MQVSIVRKGDKFKQDCYDSDSSTTTEFQSVEEDSSDGEHQVDQQDQVVERQDQVEVEDQPVQQANNMRIVKKKNGHEKLYPKKNSIIFLREKIHANDENAWFCAKVLQKATKGGKYGPYFNIQKELNSEKCGIYIDQFDWHYGPKEDYHEYTHDSVHNYIDVEIDDE